VRVVDPFGTLEFDEDVSPKALVELETLILDLQAPASQLMRKDNLIDRFQQTGAKRLVNLHGNIHNLLANVVFRHSRHSFGVLGVLARAQKLALENTDLKNGHRR